ncbi:MAG: 4-alpha-glucanotransferase [Acidobacteriota bacterium]|nr:4-alpha-glucanotransferase [Acidobacteriota bacterium]
MTRRTSGIVLHPTSLPGPYGIGEIGPAARDFVDDLAEMGQHLWQVLPLGPTSYGDSPYQSLSTFAGNHLLISFDDLKDAGLLEEDDLKDFPQFPADHVAFGPVIEARNRVLNRVADAFAERASAGLQEAHASFCKANADWLDDYALFVALKEHHRGRPWTEWKPELRDREETALAAARDQFAARMDAVRVLQFLFNHQWRELMAYCGENKVTVMGDIPIFVAHDSADTWARPDLFYLDEKGHCTVIAGVPPDYFSETGQRWGNPLYRWDKMTADDFAWWRRRLGRTVELVDLVRIDHFRGFEAYWEIPAHEETAIKGKWVPGPNEALFEAFRKDFETLPIVAEDLGVITPPVEALRDQFELPGMKVLQFILCIYREELEEKDLPEKFPANTVCYTGTHDNDTTAGWFAKLDEDTRMNVLDHVITDGSEIHWDFIQTAWRSTSDTALTPLQDLLGLGSEARMNLPGNPKGNWHWRFSRDQISIKTKEALRQLTVETGRHGGPPMNKQGEPIPFHDPSMVPTEEESDNAL